VPKPSFTSLSVSAPFLLIAAMTGSRHVSPDSGFGKTKAHFLTSSSLFSTMDFFKQQRQAVQSTVIVYLALLLRLL